MTNILGYGSSPMIEIFKKISIWKAISDFFLFLSVWGLLSGQIGEQFYPLASWIILFGAIITLIYIIKSLTKRKT